MTNDPDEILDGLFHACAFAAFLEQAHAQQGWPDMDATRLRAFTYYEQELAIKNGRIRQPVAIRQPSPPPPNGSAFEDADTAVDSLAPLPIP